ncbi:MAG TPA: LCP family protein [Actinomycetota bacterium]
MLLYGLVVVVVLAVGVYGTTFYLANRNINKAREKIEQLTELASGAPDQPRNVLIVGSDSRAGITKKDRRKGLGGPTGQRADVIILLHLEGGGKGASMLSLPRDLRVPIPGHGLDKINAAFAYGDSDKERVNLLVETVQDFTGVPIHHFVGINFFSFRGIVDAVDGVNIVVDGPIHDDKAKLDVPSAGCWHMNGDQALAYVRARSFDPTADIGRIARQQRFMRAVIDRLKSVSLLLRPDRVLRVSERIGESMIIDQKVDLGLAQAIAARLATVGQSNVDFRITPYSSAYIDGISYLIPDQPEARRLFDAIRDDRPLPRVGTTSESVPTRSDVSVLVRNGTNKAGLAGKHARKLGGKRFDVVGAENNPGSAKRTRIVYAAGQRLAAELLEKLYPTAQVRAAHGTQPADVVLVLGRDLLRGESDPAGTPTARTPPHEGCKALPA